jgi:hypothetical protein
VRVVARNPEQLQSTQQRLLYNPEHRRRKTLKYVRTRAQANSSHLLRFELSCSNNNLALDVQAVTRAAGFMFNRSFDLKSATGASGSNPDSHSYAIERQWVWG